MASWGSAKEPSIGVLFANTMSNGSPVCRPICVQEEQNTSLPCLSLNWQPYPQAWPSEEHGCSTAMLFGSLTTPLFLHLSCTVKASASPLTHLSRSCMELSHGLSYGEVFSPTWPWSQQDCSAFECRSQCRLD